MRQAGRSLPEYREIRERHSLFEIVAAARALRRGDAAAGAPPRRRRRRAVRGHHVAGPRDGHRRRARRGRRARRRRSRCASPPTSSGCACPSPRRRSPRSSRRCGSSARELDAEKALVGFCGGPFTVAATSSRAGRAATSCASKPLMYREPGRLARADGQARRHVRGLRRRAGRRGRRRRSSSSTRGSARSRPPTTRSSSRRTRRGSSPRSTCRRSTSAPGTAHLLARARARGRRRDRPRLARAARRRLGRGRARPRRPGQPRPRALLGPGSASKTRRIESSRAREGGRVTSSTSATASLPADRPGRPAGGWWSVVARAVDARCAV